MKTPSLQEQLFEIILNRYERRADAVDALCLLLNLAKDPVYRRIRCDTFLPPDELSLLARHYGISLDALIMRNSDQISCNFNAFSKRITGFSDYLESFIEDFEKIHRLPNAHLYYASAELPMFTYHLFPELISFKLYIWGRTTWNLEFLKNRQFSLDLVTPPIIRLSQDCLNHYLRLNSTELWTVQIMDNILAQIEYHVMLGGFRDPNEAIILIDRLIDWVNHMKNFALTGKKFNVGEKSEYGSGEINLFYNEMVYTNITALITSDVGRMVYTGFCTPNFLRTTDNKLCDYAEEWFSSIIAKSSRISGESEKLREWYFKEINQKIERRKQRILLHIDENF
ncbi:MAG: hypothetical protein JNJ57_05150 [Saprospiraceae bacterium]|nr:hypothetical protein [Saprospiraceae bacterium]